MTLCGNYVVGFTDLRNAPRGFQDHFAVVMKLLGFQRLKSDASIYVHYGINVILFAYVDDLMAFHLPEGIRETIQELDKHLLLRKVGTLNRRR